MPKVTLALSKQQMKDATAAAAKAGKRIELADGSVPGLRYRVTPRARATWVVTMRDAVGNWRSFPVEHDPADVEGVREAARTIRKAVLAKADPLEERRQRRQSGPLAKQGTGSLKAVLDTYAETVGRTKRSWTLLDKSIRRVFKRHLDQPVGALTVKALQATIDQHPGTQSAAHAVRAFRPVLRWAEKHASDFPAGLWAVEPPPSNPARARVLSAAEVAALVPVLRKSVHGRAMLFMLLTLGRNTEVCEARWRDIGTEEGGRAQVWTVPTNKSGVKHVVPLSRAAVLVAGSRGHDDAMIFATRRGSKLGNWDRTAKDIMEEAGVAHFTRHDLRRTGATMLAEMGTPPHVVESALGHVHVHTALASVYSRVRYTDDVRTALDKLAWKVMPLDRAEIPETADTERYGEPDGTEGVDIATAKGWVEVKA